MLVSYVVIGLFSLLCLAGAIFLGRFAFTMRKTFTTLKDKGVTIQGIIGNKRQKEVRRARGGSYTEYSFEYSYVYGGQSYTKEQLVSKQHYDGWFKGMPVSVTCLPDKPETARLGDDATPNVMMYASWGGAVVLFAGAIALVIIAVKFPM